MSKTIFSNDELYMAVISSKLANLKNSLNMIKSLSLVDYDTLHGDIEELQYLVDDLIKGEEV